MCTAAVAGGELVLVVYIIIIVLIANLGSALLPCGVGECSRAVERVCSRESVCICRGEELAAKSHHPQVEGGGGGWV